MKKMDVKWVQMLENKVQAGFISEITCFKKILVLVFLTKADHLHPRDSWNGTEHWIMSLRILGVTLNCVWRWCLREWQCLCWTWLICILRYHLKLRFSLWCDLKRVKYLDFCVLSEVALRFCREVSGQTSCRSFGYCFYWKQVDHWHIVSHGSPEVIYFQNGFLWSLLESS